MKIRTKISAVNIILVLLTAILITILTVNHVNYNAKISLIRSENEMISLLGDKIRDTVNMAYEQVNSNYMDCRNEKYLKKTYGPRLTDIVCGLQSAATDVKSTDQFNNLAGKIHRTRIGHRHIVWLVDVSSKRYLEICHRGHVRDSDWQPLPQTTLATLQRIAKDNKGAFLFNENPMLPTLSYYQIVNNGKLIIGAGVDAKTLQEDAKEKSKDALRNMICNNGMGYIFINNMRCYSVMHPFMPEIEGRDYSHITDAKGKRHVVEMANICREKGEGFLEYYWPKHEKDKIHVKIGRKLSYVKLFKPWGWIIGTGIYIDNVRKMIQAKELANKKQIDVLIKQICIVTLMTLLLMILISVILAQTMSRPLVKMLQSMKKVDLNNLDDSRVHLSGPSEIRDLGTIFNSMKDSLRENLEKIRRTTAEKEKFQSELGIARDIQMSIIPRLHPSFPDRPEFEIFAMLDAAKLVGGDLYDFFFIDNDHLCFVVGDVSGKGVPASLFMAVTRTLLHAKATKGASAKEIVSRVNATLCIDNEKSMFVSLFLAVLDLRTGEMNYCNAGHSHPYIVRKQQKIEKLSARHGVPLGVIDFFAFSDDTVKLDHGDTIIVFSDGVVEAVNPKGELFGEEALEKIIAGNMLLSPKGYVDMIVHDVHEFIGDAEQSDDMTLLALSYRGSNNN